MRWFGVPREGQGGGSAADARGWGAATEGREERTRKELRAWRCQV